MMSNVDDYNYYSYNLDDPYEKMNITTYHYYTRGAKNKPNPLSNEILNKSIREEEKRKRELNENLENAIKQKKDIENESKDSIDEINRINKEINDLESKIEKNRKETNDLKNKYSKLKNEKEDFELKFKKEFENLELAKKNYLNIKKEYDDLKIPDRMDEPTKNSPKSELVKYKKYIEERDKIKTKKNQLVITLRNREIDVQKAEEIIKKAKEQPSDKQIIDQKIKSIQKEYENDINIITKLRTDLRKHNILLSKLEICDNNIKKANDEKFKYDMRGMTVISKNSTLNYDKNGNLIKYDPNTKLFNKELQDLKLKPPMKDTRSINYMVSIELDYLKNHYNSRMDMVNSYRNSKNLDYDTIMWIKNNDKELKEMEKQINELDGKYYNNDLWLEIDKEEYERKRKEIFDKYGYEYIDELNIQPKEKKYSMEDFMKSIGKK